MSSEAEPAKVLLPYLQRADELQKHEPLVAYYCRLFAMEKGLKISTKDRTKTTNSILVSLMNQLEKDKKSLKLSSEDNLYIEGFASNVFTRADKQDRAGRADLNTAKTFYAASIFFEILHQFGEMQPDIEQKQKYAAWKAADIRKALKEGRKPEPGPPGGEEETFTPTNHDEGTHQQETSTPNSPPPRSPDHVDLINSNPPPSTQRSQSPPYSRHNQDPSYPYDHQFTHQNVAPEVPPPSSHQPSQDQSPPTYPSSYDYDRSSETYPQHYPSHETSTGSPSPYTYTHFQTYPSFNDCSLPVAPTHHTSYYHGSETSQPVYQLPPSPPPAPYQLPPQPVKKAPSYDYDSSYQPPVEKIAEAHKAARFAVGALAFDDVPVAVDFLRRSLELLTNPSAEPH